MLFADALAAVGLADREGVYWAGRATLVRRPEDIDEYDRGFDALFGTLSGPVGLHSEVLVEEVVVAFDLPAATEPSTPIRTRSNPTSRSSRCATARPRCCATATSRPTARPSTTKLAG